MDPHNCMHISTVICPDIIWPLSLVWSRHRSKFGSKIGVSSGAARRSKHSATLANANITFVNFRQHRLSPMTARRKRQTSSLETAPAARLLRCRCRWAVPLPPPTSCDPPTVWLTLLQTRRIVSLCQLPTTSTTAATPGDGEICQTWALRSPLMSVISAVMT